MWKKMKIKILFGISKKLMNATFKLTIGESVKYFLKTYEHSTIFLKYVNKRYKISKPG